MHARRRLIASALATAAVVAAQAHPAVAKARIDPRADQTLRAMCSNIAAQESFELVAEVTFDRVFEGGQKLESRERVRLAVRRPSALAEDITGDAGTRSLRYDGKRFSIVDTRDGVYGGIDAPDSIDATLNDLWARYDLAVPLGELALSDPYAAFSSKIRSGFYVGEVEIDGKAAHHLAFQQDVIDWQVWIDAGPEPLPLRIVITYKTVPQAPQYRADIVGWRAHAVLSDREFALVVPSDADEIPLLPSEGGLSEQLP